MRDEIGLAILLDAVICPNKRVPNLGGGGCKEPRKRHRVGASRTQGVVGCPVGPKKGLTLLERPPRPCRPSDQNDVRQVQRERNQSDVQLLR